MKRERIYSTSMALIYDELMRDIDYELWSDFIDDIIQEYAPDTQSILELACGTGSFAISLDELDCYDITATDMSSDMINVAREKAKSINATVKFQTMDYRNIDISKRFDTVIMLFDSINYMMQDNDILNVFNQVKKVLNERGLFIFDFTTPVNSEKAVDLLNEERTTENGYYYKRQSRYDKQAGIHYNEFLIKKIGDGQPNENVVFSELHQERVYTLEHIDRLVRESGYHVLARYDAFDMIDANENSDRITMVLQ